MSNISVIITAYNQALWVVQAVESILIQRSQPVEVIVVDDGSTDETPALLLGLPGLASYIRQPHRGTMAARLAGLKASKGTLVTFMRAEDLMPAAKLEVQAQRLEKQAELGLVYFDRPLSGDKRIYFIREAVSDGVVLPDSAAVAAEFFLSGGPLIRRDCLERIGFREAALDPETDWNPWERLTLAGYDLDPQERSALQREHLYISFRKYAAGERGPARRHLIEAIRLRPSVLEAPQIFSETILEYTKQPEIGDPVAFAQTVLDNLPDCAQRLKRLKPHIIAELSVARSFRNYALGDMAQVGRSVATSLRYDLSHLRNKGVVSIFCKSLLNRNGGSRFAGGGDGEFEILRWVLKDVQQALGQSVDYIEPTTSGTERSTYMIKSSGQPFILRLVKEQDEALTVNYMQAVIGRIRAAGMPAPSILASNFPPPGAPHPAWTVEEWMPGHFFAPLSMRWRDALDVTTELGRYLRQLHGIETGGFGFVSNDHLEAKYRTLEQWLDVFGLDNRQILLGLPVEMHPLITKARRFLQEAYQGKPRLCHFDLHGRNLLVDGGHLSAVIDWHDVCGCDPALDVANFHFWMDNEEILAALLQGYTPVEPEMFRRRVIAGVICFAAAFLAATDLRPTVDKQALHRRCLRWLTDDRLSSFIQANALNQ